ncbi:GTP-binding protein [Tepidiforma flava]|uniref:sulfate adenylyltransferase n=1 Tax=Tepidiforma flava TaxID=3004094 RepID=A0ABY7M6Y7_9CHLR|nr:GTP-binding protein [Tepidiforma flava]WBL35830.1 GTP-binding protein [Tepidiforma flava]
MDLLRFVTAGSVDDGKSTLIGRLLYDTRQVFEDTLASIERASQAQGLDEINLALLTDGLRAEREQGITIDVAYRYFATPRRKFIIADAPGHVQYTRNMVTGASTAQLALILVDARKGVVEQTRRHSALAALLGIHHVVLSVNKMDLVGWSEERFREVEAEYRGVAASLGIDRVAVIPLAALTGANLVHRASELDWYGGPTLLEFLETVQVRNPARSAPFRFPVQYVIRPQSREFPDYRGYAGTVAAGAVRVGDAVRVLPLGAATQVAAIDRFEESLEEASAGDAVTIRLADELDAGRGAMFVAAGDPVAPASAIEADVCWMSEDTCLAEGQQVLVKHTTRRTRAVVEQLVDRLDIHRLAREPFPERLGLNDIGRVRLRLMEPVVADLYDACRETGAFILIDPATRHTTGAGMTRAVASNAKGGAE